MLEINLQVGGKAFTDLARAFDLIGRNLEGAMDRAAPQIGREMQRVLERIHRSLANKHGTPWSAGSGSRATLQKRSGQGLRSIKESIEVNGIGSLNTVVARISTGDMTIHETGGIIRATRSKYLTIPLPAAMNARGIPLRRRARDWNNTFVARSRKGNLLIFQKKGRNGIVPLYVLKESVRIPARLGLQAEIMGGLPYFERRAFAAIERQLSEVL